MKSINLMKNVGWFTPSPEVTKYNLPQIIYPQIICTIYPPKSPNALVLCMNL